MSEGFVTGLFNIKYATAYWLSKVKEEEVKEEEVTPAQQVGLIVGAGVVGAAAAAGIYAVPYLSSSVARALIPSAAILLSLVGEPFYWKGKHVKAAGREYFETFEQLEEPNQLAKEHLQRLSFSPGKQRRKLCRINQVHDRGL